MLDYYTDGPLDSEELEDLIPCQRWHLQAADYLHLQHEGIDGFCLAVNSDPEPCLLIPRIYSESFSSRANVLISGRAFRLELNELAFSAETHSRLEAAYSKIKNVRTHCADGIRDLSGRYRSVRREERKANLGGY